MSELYQNLQHEIENTTDDLLKLKDKINDYIQEVNNHIDSLYKIIINQQKELEKLKDVLYHKQKMIDELTQLEVEHKMENGQLRTELNSKDKIIDEMFSEYEFNSRINVKHYCEEKMRKDTCIQDCENCIKQYFANQVKENR